MPLDAVPDHVAVAVADLDVADARWCGELGGRWVSWSAGQRVFRSRQVRYAGGAKLELIAPHERDASPDNFVRRYLARFGSRIHHVTLKVDDLGAAIAELGQAGLDVVDVDTSTDFWREAFLRPSQVGGLIVQVAWAAMDDDGWAAALGHTPQPVPPDAARLLGPTLTHPDPAEAEKLWTLLGAEPEHDESGFTCRWRDAPLTVRIEEGATAGPVHLRFAGTPPLPADDTHGPAVRPTDR